MESKASSRLCFICGNGDSQRCSGCKQVMYCSKKCQKKHWKTHKLECGKKDENSNYGGYDFNKIRDTIEKSCPKVTLTFALYEAAKRKAEKMFPSQTILCKLDDLSPRPRYDAMFVAFISNFHPYVFRHAVYIQDMNSRESFLTFYLDYDKPEPYFTWLDVRPGCFIVVFQPHLHFFMDGQVGFRIEEPHEIRILDVNT